MKVFKTNTFNLKVGDKITFTNSVNYPVVLTVTRVTEKSWYAGKIRRSYGTLQSFAVYPDFKIISPAL